MATCDIIVIGTAPTIAASRASPSRSRRFAAVGLSDAAARGLGATKIAAGFSARAWSAPHADEVINLFGLAIRHGLTVNDLKGTMFVYPTGASDIGSML
jgi:pyruvate/2-oxoglutarate dehydrogenase complex dihydrolipoamide dehydrogenase (E3) component